MKNEPYTFWWSNGSPREVAKCRRIVSDRRSVTIWHNPSDCKKIAKNRRSDFWQDESQIGCIGHDWRRDEFFVYILMKKHLSQRLYIRKVFNASRCRYLGCSKRIFSNRAKKLFHIKMTKFCHEILRHKLPLFSVTLCARRISVIPDTFSSVYWRAVNVVFVHPRWLVQPLCRLFLSHLNDVLREQNRSKGLKLKGQPV